MTDEPANLNVVAMPPPHDLRAKRECVRKLEDLLDEARAGKFVALVYVAVQEDGISHTMGWTSDVARLGAGIVGGLERLKLQVLSMLKVTSV